jgi:hypothetical protein
MNRPDTIEITKLNVFEEICALLAKKVGGNREKSHSLPPSFITLILIHSFFADGPFPLKFGKIEKALIRLFQHSKSERLKPGLEADFFIFVKGRKKSSFFSSFRIFTVFHTKFFNVFKPRC